MVLVDKELIAQIKEQELLSEFTEENLQACSYDLTMTENILKFNENTHTRIRLADKDKIDDLFTEVDISGGYDLRPHEYVLVEMKEKIKMPQNLCGYVRPRTTLTKIGLQITPQFVNPTYEGRLRLGLYNASPFIIEIVPSLIIGQIVFEQLSDVPSNERLYRNKKNSKYQNEDRLFVSSKIYEEIDPKFKSYYDSVIKKIRE